MDSADISSWADQVVTMRYGPAVDEAFRTPDKALGPAAGNSFDIVSLGRGGSIILSFSEGISNGPGWDFAVFENAFDDFFLELGTVAVSSDGITYHSFDTVSLTPAPIPAFGEIDVTEVNGFAGTFRQGFGTPFDFDDLPDGHGLDLSQVRYVMITDVVGDGTVLDTGGNVIYDPYPTVGSAGIDLDAIGVRHEGVFDGYQYTPGNAWSYSETLGWYIADQFPWVFQAEQGWWYVATDDHESLWIYDLNRGWLFTGMELYPLVYVNGDWQQL